MVRLQKDSSTSAVPQFSPSLAHCHTPLLGTDLATLCRRGAAVSCSNPPSAAAFMLQGLFTNDYLLEFSSALFEVEPLRLVPMTCSQWTGPAHLPDPSRRDGSQTCFTLNPARPARQIRSTPHAAGSHRAPVAHSRVVDLDLDGGQTPMDGLISTPDPECGHMPNAKKAYRWFASSVSGQCNHEIEKLTAPAGGTFTSDAVPDAHPGLDVNHEHLRRGAFSRATGDLCP